MVKRIISNKMKSSFAAKTIMSDDEEIQIAVFYI